LIEASVLRASTVSKGELLSNVRLDGTETLPFSINC
jgi:hypothetical protein